MDLYRENKLNRYNSSASSWSNKSDHNGSKEDTHQNYLVKEDSHIPHKNCNILNHAKLSKDHVTSFIKNFEKENTRFHKVSSEKKEKNQTKLINKDTHKNKQLNKKELLRRNKLNQTITQNVDYHPNENGTCHKTNYVKGQRVHSMNGCGNDYERSTNSTEMNRFFLVHNQKHSKLMKPKLKRNAHSLSPSSCSNRNAIHFRQKKDAYRQTQNIPENKENTEKHSKKNPYAVLHNQCMVSPNDQQPTVNRNNSFGNNIGGKEITYEEEKDSKNIIRMNNTMIYYEPVQDKVTSRDYMKNNPKQNTEKDTNTQMKFSIHTYRNNRNPQISKNMYLQNYIYNEVQGNNCKLKKYHLYNEESSKESQWNDSSIEQAMNNHYLISQEHDENTNDMNIWNVSRMLSKSYKEICSQSKGTQQLASVIVNYKEQEKRKAHNVLMQQSMKLLYNRNSVEQIKNTDSSEIIGTASSFSNLKILPHEENPCGPKEQLIAYNKYNHVPLLETHVSNEHQPNPGNLENQRCTLNETNQVQKKEHSKSQQMEFQMNPYDTIYEEIQNTKKKRIFCEIMEEADSQQLYQNKRNKSGEVEVQDNDNAKPAENELNEMNKLEENGVSGQNENGNSIYGSNFKMDKILDRSENNETRNDLIQNKDKFVGSKSVKYERNYSSVNNLHKAQYKIIRIDNQHYYEGYFCLYRYYIVRTEPDPIIHNKNREKIMIEINLLVKNINDTANPMKQTKDMDDTHQLFLKKYIELNREFSNDDRNKEQSNEEEIKKRIVDIIKQECVSNKEQNSQIINLVINDPREYAIECKSRHIHNDEPEYSSKCTYRDKTLKQTWKAEEQRRKKEEKKLLKIQKRIQKEEEQTKRKLLKEEKKKLKEEEKILLKEEKRKKKEEKEKVNKMKRIYNQMNKKNVFSRKKNIGCSDFQGNQREWKIGMSHDESSIDLETSLCMHSREKTHHSVSLQNQMEETSCLKEENVEMFFKKNKKVHIPIKIFLDIRKSNTPKEKTNKTTRWNQSEESKKDEEDKYSSGNWIVAWIVNGRTCKKSFSIDDYGFIKAKELAEKFKEERIQCIVNQLDQFDSFSRIFERFVNPFSPSEQENNMESIESLQNIPKRNKKSFYDIQDHDKQSKEEDSFFTTFTESNKDRTSFFNGILKNPLFHTYVKNNITWVNNPSGWKIHFLKWEDGQYKKESKFYSEEKINKNIARYRAVCDFLNAQHNVLTNYFHIGIPNVQYDIKKNAWKIARSIPNMLNKKNYYFDVNLHGWIHSRKLALMLAIYALETSLESTSNKTEEKINDMDTLDQQNVKNLNEKKRWDHVDSEEKAYETDQIKQNEKNIIVTRESDITDIHQIDDKDQMINEEKDHFKGKIKNVGNFIYGQTNLTHEASVDIMNDFLESDKFNENNVDNRRNKELQILGTKPNHVVQKEELLVGSFANDLNMQSKKNKQTHDSLENKINQNKHVRNKIEPYKNWKEPNDIEDTNGLNHISMYSPNCAKKRSEDLFNERYFLLRKMNPVKDEKLLELLFKESDRELFQEENIKIHEQDEHLLINILNEYYYSNVMKKINKIIKKRKQMDHFFRNY